jgi:ABC-type multidrug transport system fused ATPase/permease subunit
VLEKGRIIEQGRHQDLIFGNGRYQRLHEAHARMN